MRHLAIHRIYPESSAECRRECSSGRQFQPPNITPPYLKRPTPITGSGRFLLFFARTNHTNYATNTDSWRSTWALRLTVDRGYLQCGSLAPTLGGKSHEKMQTVQSHQ